MSEEMQALKFTLKLKQVPVELEKEDGTVRQCMLMELSGDLRDEYMEEMRTYMVSTEEDADGTPQVKKVKGLNTLLITKCLHDVLPDGTRKLVDPKEIAAFPVTVLDALKTTAQKISGLKQPVRNPETGKWEMPSEDDAKNGSSEAKPNSGSN